MKKNIFTSLLTIILIIGILAGVYYFISNNNDQSTGPRNTIINAGDGTTKDPLTPVPFDPDEIGEVGEVKYIYNGIPLVLDIKVTEYSKGKPSRLAVTGVNNNISIDCMCYLNEKTYMTDYGMKVTAYSLLNTIAVCANEKQTIITDYGALPQKSTMASPYTFRVGKKIMLLHNDFFLNNNDSFYMFDAYFYNILMGTRNAKLFPFTLSLSNCYRLTGLDVDLSVVFNFIP